MKTSNKLLLTVLIITLLGIVGVMVYIRTQINLEAGISGTGNVVIERREVENFDAVSIQGRFDVEISQQPEFALYVDADQNLHHLIETRVEGNTLYIDQSKHVADFQKFKIVLSMPELSGIQLAGGVRAGSDGVIRGEHLVIKVSSGARSTMELDYDRLELVARAGGHVVLSGRVESMRMETLAGAVVEAEKLAVDECDVQAGVGSIAQLNVTNRISGKAGYGAVVFNHADALTDELDVRHEATFESHEESHTATTGSDPGANNSGDLPEGLIVTQEYVLLALHRNMARESLEAYARTLQSEAGIEVAFPELMYDNLGRIRYIAMEVDCGDGFEGKTSFPVNTDHFRFGFIRRYDEEAETEFLIGPLEDALI